MPARFAAACALTLSTFATAAAANPAGEEAITFTAASGASVEAFRGGFEVPENRADPDSRMIPIRYVRFPATGLNPGSPIVYLAGGPGAPGIGTAQRERFPLFMAMREFGDVIALDQRGVGESKATPTCVSSVVPPADVRLREAELAALHRQAAEQCGAFWAQQGVDVAGYTTVESVRDLDALREHLGAEKLTLWGISYGTHLALAAMKEMDGRIDRVVLASAEGLDQTVKLPAETDAYFARLQAAIDADPEMRALFPDAAGLIRRMQDRFDENPVMVQADRRDGSTAAVLLTREALQIVTSALIADPGSAIRVLSLYAALDAGHIEPVAGLLGNLYPAGAPIVFDAMPLAMDVASGVSEQRLALIEEQAETALLGAWLNFPMPQLRGALGLDLGDAFRAPPESDVPTLLLTGTLDGRTYPAEQAAAVAGLSALTHITVVNAGHNLFMTTPEVTGAIQRFMRGETIAAREIVAPPPSLPSAP